MTTFNSPFRKELEAFLSIRQASLSKSTYAHDCYYLQTLIRLQLDIQMKSPYQKS